LTLKLLEVSTSSWLSATDAFSYSLVKEHRPTAASAPPLFPWAAPPRPRGVCSLYLPQRPWWR